MRIAALHGNPYLFLGRRPFREARLRSYIVGQHRRGRPMAEILDDPYVHRCGNDTYVWSVVLDPRTAKALGENFRAARDDVHPA
jgi:hypothetical protein